MLPLLAGAAFQVIAAVRVPAADSTRPEEELRQAGVRFAPAVRGCYEREGLRVDPTLQGTLDVTLFVAATGAADSVRADSSAVKGSGMPAVTACVLRAAAAWRLSSGYAKEEATFTFHLVPPPPS